MKKSKTQKIKEHLQSGKTITSWEAIELYNVTRLAAIIFNLKEEGLNIRTTNKVHENQGGETVRFAEYKCLNIEEDKTQLGMFTDNSKEFKRWLDTPPKLKKGDIR